MDDPQQAMVRVNIYGHEYSVRAAADRDYITEVAAYVDERMRDTELNLEGSQSSTRIAILAAMSISDELFTERRKRLAALNQIEGRAVSLANLVEDVLESPTDD